MNQKELEAKIIYHKNLYYRGIPEITDEEFDQLEDLLRKIAPTSYVLSMVGSTVFSSEKIAHKTKMLSLNKTYSKEELLKWKKDLDLISTFKIDGSSCSLLYTDGLLTHAKTRGNGVFGENITEKILFFSNVPKKLSDNRTMEVRGEVFCTENNFQRLKEQMNKKGLNTPSSKRNIVAGLLGRKENIDLASFLNFQAFELMVDELELEKEIEKFHYLKELGFSIPDYTLIRNEKDIEKVLDEAQKFIAQGDYLIDGLVFAYNDLDLHRDMGQTAHHPRFKIAFKFKGDEAISIIKSISWQVSRNGILTPVANIETVELSGANVSRVTLHNWGNVKDHQLKKGDLIKITRSGEVIPKFLEVVESSKEKFVRIQKCPSCNSEVIEKEIRLYCHNENCTGKKLDEFNNFISKIGIEDLSKKRIEQLINAGLLNDIDSLFDLSNSDLLKLDKIKEKLSTKLIKSIEKVKNTDLVTFLAALGLSGGAYNTCEKIVNAGYDSIDKILNMKAEDLQKIDSFAEKSSSDLVNSIKQKKELMLRLIEKGFKFKKIEGNNKNTLKDLKFCITGTLSMKRSELEKIIKKNGGECLSTVNSKTSYLVTNDTESNSSKFKKAKELEITILNENQLMELIDGKN